MSATSVWFPDAFEGVPEAAIERLTRTTRLFTPDFRCCLWTWIGDTRTTCVRCTVAGALLVGHSGQYVITRHHVHTTPDGDLEHQALWSPHTCTPKEQQ